MGDWSRVARRIRVPLGFVFAVLYFWLARPNWISIFASLALIVPGLLVRAFASGHVQKNEILATSGPYAHTRNPLYLGSLLMGLGFAFAARSWWIGILLVVMFVAIYNPVIRSEENFLRQQFPEYEDYARHVPRLLPGRKAYHKSTVRGDFSPDLYLKHREYNAALGAMGMLALLVIRMIWLW